jgi:hypothetical protein
LLGVARQENITDDEIGAVLGITMAVYAGGVRGRTKEAFKID